ncbi:MAG: PD40 domain-containing protein [Deltaproteobacteria bacterium]|nr:PD40 domain-containing protein [Deltaproteobacteria bacterium]
MARADHRLVEPLEITRGDYLGPRFAPDGRELLVTGPQLRGLYLASLAGGVRLLTDDAEAGVHARWSTDGSISFRALRAGTRRDLAVTRQGQVRTQVPAAPLAFTKDDRFYVTDRTGRLARIGSGDRFFSAVVAPDGDKVVVQGLATGLHVYTRSTGTLVHIGPGTAPAWSPDSARLVYEVTEDDGHDLVASDLYLYTVATDTAQPLTATDRVLERRPSFSPSGTSIAFDDNTGGIYVGRLEIR